MPEKLASTRKRPYKNCGKGPFVPITASRLAKKPKIMFPRIVQAVGDVQSPFKVARNLTVVPPARAS